MTKQLNFKRCKAFLAMLLVLCQLFSIFGGIMPFKFEKAQAMLPSYVIYVEKTDPDGNLLGGAELELANAYGNPISIEYVQYGNFNENGEFVANEDYSKYDEVSSFVTMEGYVTAIKTSRVPFYLREISAPEGYDIAEDVMIASADLEDDNTAHVTMIDQKKTINNSSGKNDEPNKPLSTDDEVVNKGEDIEVSFNNHIHTVQNLTVTKVLKEELLDGNLGESLSEAEFNFKAYFSNMKEGDAFNAYNGEGDDAEVVGTVTADVNGEAEFAFNLKNKETIYFKELPVNVQYQIEEILDADDGTAPLDFEPAYLVSGIIEGKNADTGNRGENLITEVQTLEAREEGSVIFTNTKKMDYGKLVVEKKVENNENSNEEFEFTITLTGENIFGTQVINDVTFVNGVAKIYLKNGESKEFDLPDGTTYKVEETEYQNYDTNYSMEVVDPYAVMPTAEGTGISYLWIYKTDEEGNYVEGATLQLTYPDGTVIEEWTSLSSPKIYTIPNNGRVFGYVLHEVSAPAGYEIADDIILSSDNVVYSHTNDNSEPIYKVYMVDEKIDDEPIEPITYMAGSIIKDKYSKVTVTNTYKVGKLVVTKEVVGNEDTQQSFQFTITLTGDEIGGKQTFNGVEFNDGVGVIYLKNGESKEFDLPDGTTYKVEETQYESYDASYSEEVIDPYANVNPAVFSSEVCVRIHKVDPDMNYVEGAKLELILADTRTGETYTSVSWTSSDDYFEYYINYSEDKSYTLREIVAPEGYTIAADIPIYFGETDETDDQGIAPLYNIYMVDEKIEHKDIAIHKIDNNNNYVQGATLQLINASTYEVVDEWITDNAPHTVTVDDAYNYIVREVSAPEGYTPASDITFNPKETTEVTMINVKNNKNVTIKKVDKNDAYVQGATLQVLNASTNEVVAEWVSGNGEYIVSLDPDYSYILHEASAPEGYELAEDITFNPNDVTEVTMVNNKIKLMFMRGTIERDIYKVVKVTNTYIPTEDEVAILKVDSDNNPLAGATLQIIDADGNVVDEWVSTNEEHRISLVYGTYTLHEAKAPRGYRLAEDIEFTVAEGSYNTVIMVDPPISVMVSTGGTGTIITIVMAAIFGGFAGALIYLAKKKEKEEAKSNKTTETEEYKNE